MGCLFMELGWRCTLSMPCVYPTHVLKCFNHWDCPYHIETSLIANDS
jgi:hypothetical protein